MQFGPALWNSPVRVREERVAVSSGREHFVSREAAGGWIHRGADNFPLAVLRVIEHTLGPLRQTAPHCESIVVACLPLTTRALDAKIPGLIYLPAGCLCAGVCAHAQHQGVFRIGEPSERARSHGVGASEGSHGRKASLKSLCLFYTENH